MAKPLVAVARWEDVPGESIESYWNRLRQAELEPVDLHEPDRSLEGYEALLLTGGIDVDPVRYGETPGEYTRHTNPDRDAFEARLLQQALELDMPVLAICRGHQLLNVVMGGSLLQHIANWAHAASRDDDHTSAQHVVALQTGTRLYQALGQAQVTVNSRHHQGVTLDRLASGLTVAALSNDGLVEAMESAEHRWVVGVQWHPERQEPAMPGFDETGVRVFAAFASAIRDNASASSNRL